MGIGVGETVRCVIVSGIRRMDTDVERSRHGRDDNTEGELRPVV